MPLASPQTKPKTITPKDAEAVAPSDKATRPQTKEVTTPDLQHPWERPQHPEKPTTRAPQKCTPYHPPIHSSRSTTPPKSCHDTKKTDHTPQELLGKGPQVKPVIYY